MTRRRQGKRLTRMDAALDAMVLLGFPKEMVKKRLRQLLRVYGGDNGWPFIEDSAYKELIEALLCDDDENDQEKLTEDCSSSKDKCTESETAASDASSQVSDRPQDEKSIVITPVDTRAEPPQPKPVSSSCLRTEEGGDYAWKDIFIHHPSGDGEETGISGKETSPFKNPIPASSPSSSNLSRLGCNLPQRWSLPCYGWIQSDEEEDLDDFFELTATPWQFGPMSDPPPAPGEFGPMPAPPPGSCATSLRCNTRSKKKCKSRWDVKPSDPY